MSEELHSVYRQLNDLNGSTNAIKELIREIQDQSQQAKSDINVSGNKEDLVRNLRIAVDKNYISVHRVLSLVKR